METEEIFDAAVALPAVEDEGAVGEETVDAVVGPPIRTLATTGVCLTISRFWAFRRASLRFVTFWRFKAVILPVVFYKIKKK